jgi:hypothetical protein
MKKMIGYLLLLLVGTLHAQKNIDSLINAERSFAAYSVAHGMKEAFLKYLDSSSVVFEQGKAVNGIEAWSKKGKTAGILNWYPQFAELATSGELGYTSGSWTFQQKSVNDSIIARGGYNSIWLLNKNGEWKNIIDLGVSKTPANSGNKITKIKAARVTSSNPDINSLLQSDKAFVKIFNENPQLAYKQFLSGQSILNRNGHLPATTANDQLPVIDATPSTIQFSTSGYSISHSGDLGYVYGSGSVNGKNFNFLRVWRKEKSGWKIALDVLPV